MSSGRIIGKRERIFDGFNAVLMFLVIIVTLYPFWYVIVASLSSISHVTNSVVLLWPDGLQQSSDCQRQISRLRYHLHCRSQIQVI